jgi:hypothetical protein
MHANALAQCRCAFLLKRLPKLFRFFDMGTRVRGFQKSPLRKLQDPHRKALLKSAAICLAMNELLPYINTAFGYIDRQRPASNCFGKDLLRGA